MNKTYLMCKLSQLYSTHTEASEIHCQTCNYTSVNLNTDVFRATRVLLGKAVGEQMEEIHPCLMFISSQPGYLSI